ncbi:MAG: hypothetical protein JKY37_26210 [Nannocystaceae bacterium]|nr:hypothetical protein [Nannocystaceae bacterium]
MDVTKTTLDALGEGKAPAHETVVAALAMAADADEVAWHPTGFLVARLAERGEQTLRLHIWPDGDRVYGEPLWPFHDHVFSLSSLVLAGAVGSQKVHVTDVEAGLGSRRRYAVDYGVGGRRSRLIACGGVVQTREGALRTTHPGAVYKIAAGEFHASSAAPNRLSATLVATRTALSRRPFVLGPVAGRAAVDVRRASVHAARWRSLVEQVQRAWAAVVLPA